LNFGSHLYSACNIAYYGTLEVSKQLREVGVWIFNKLAILLLYDKDIFLLILSRKESTSSPPISLIRRKSNIFKNGLHTTVVEPSSDLINKGLRDSNIDSSLSELIKRIVVDNDIWNNHADAWGTCRIGHSQILGIVVIMITVFQIESLRNQMGSTSTNCTKFDSINSQNSILGQILSIKIGRHVGNNMLGEIYNSVSIAMSSILKQTA